MFAQWRFRQSDQNLPWTPFGYLVMMLSFFMWTIKTDQTAQMCRLIWVLTRVLLNPDIPCICKQCRSRSVLISYIVRCFREENFYFSLLPAISDSSYVLKYVYNSVNACWPMHQGMLNMAVPCCVVSRDSVSVLKPSIWLVCIFYVNTCFITLRASWKISCCMLNVVTLFK